MPSFFPLGEYINRLRKLPAFHCLADVVHVLLVLRSLGHVHDEACVATIDIVLAAKQRGGLIQQGGGDGGQVFRQAVNLLVQVRLHQVEDATFGELVGLRGQGHMNF